MKMRWFFASVILGMILQMRISSAEISLFTQQDSKHFHSQASQDQFVYFLLYGLLDKQDKGCYLEIGAGAPIEINNSYFFEKHLQWSGVSIDISNQFNPKWQGCRINPLLIEDATQSDYATILKDFPRVMDYLSLDIDGYYDIVLEKLLFSDRVFKIITIEHDSYMHGDHYREKERIILHAFGYYLLCSDVNHWGKPYEDWWIHPSAFPPDVFYALAFLDLKNKEYTQIIQSIQNFLINYSKK